MPRIGLICDFDEQDISDEECRKCAKRGKPACGGDGAFILSILDSVEGYKPTERDKPSLSVTDLTSPCLRRQILQNKHDYRQKPSELYYMWRGGIVHKILEEVENKNYIKEQKFVVPFTIKLLGEDVEVYIVGKLDRLDIVNKEITDYKTTGSVFQAEKNISIGYKFQLGIYRWLVKNSNLDLLINDCFFTFIDMKQYRVRKISNIPFEQVEKYIQQQSAIILNGRFNDVIPKVHKQFPNWWMCRNYCPINYICSKLHYKEKR